MHLKVNHLYCKSEAGFCWSIEKKIRSRNISILLTIHSVNKTHLKAHRILKSRMTPHVHIILSCYMHSTSRLKKHTF